MTEQTNREKALEAMSKSDPDMAQFYAILDLADAVREQTTTHASYLMDLTDAVRRLENLGPMDPLLGIVPDPDMGTASKP